MTKPGQEQPKKAPHHFGERYLPPGWRRRCEDSPEAFYRSYWPALPQSAPKSASARVNSRTLPGRRRPRRLTTICRMPHRPWPMIKPRHRVQREYGGPCSTAAVRQYRELKSLYRKLKDQKSAPPQPGTTVALVSVPSRPVLTPSLQRRPVFSLLLRRSLRSHLIGPFRFRPLCYPSQQHQRLLSFVRLK